MKKLVTASLAAAMALTTVNAASNAELAAKLATLEKELATIKTQMKSQNKKINEVKSHDANDNIKWSVDTRTAIDSINYDMADGTKRSKNDLMSLRLWLNMEYAPDNNNIFKGQLSMNKAFGADFGYGNQSSTSMNRALSMGSMFDWTTNEALGGDELKVRQAYWLYMGEKAFGADIPWTFSVGRRPSTGGFLASLREDDEPLSPLGHIINVEFDGLSGKLDLSNVTGVPGMSFKLCMGQGSTAAAPMFDRLDGTQYSNTGTLDDVTLAGFIFEPYNDGQYIVKTTAFRAYDLPGYDSQNFMTAFNAQNMGAASFSQAGDMEGAAISVLVDGLAEDGFLSETKIFGSLAWSKTLPDASQQMLGVTTPLGVMGAAPGESKTGTSYWIGAQWPCQLIDNGTVGVEYNHGSQYWRPFTYAEDTMIGSKLAARGDAWEAYFTYDFSEALSAQIRYTNINYDYTGSNSFFGAEGTPMKISDVKAAAAGYNQLVAMTGSTNPVDLANAMVAGGMAPDLATASQMVGGMQMMSGFASSIVESAQDLRFYIRYRF